MNFRTEKLTNTKDEFSRAKTAMAQQEGMGRRWDRQSEVQGTGSRGQQGA